MTAFDKAWDFVKSEFNPEKNKHINRRNPTKDCKSCGKLLAGEQYDLYRECRHCGASNE